LFSFGAWQVAAIVKKHKGFEFIRKDRTIDHRGLGRLLSEIENDRDRAEEVLAAHYQDPETVQVIGITGPPGAGKSTLADCIVAKLREEGKLVAVVAVAPSSPFTGGAILGDRIRMSAHAEDPGVFIRSMASRGSLGGLAPATFDVVNFLRSVGFDAVIVETVGVGQSEIDVLAVADTVLLTLVPGLGDDVQALKAGIMEIADIFVVNKADREGKERLIAEIRMVLDLNRERFVWIPPIVETVATERRGITDLVGQIEAHRAYVRQHRAEVRRGRLARQLEKMVAEKVERRLYASLGGARFFDEWAASVASGKENPYSLLKKIEKLISTRTEELS